MCLSLLTLAHSCHYNLVVIHKSGCSIKTPVGCEMKKGVFYEFNSSFVRRRIRDLFSFSKMSHSLNFNLVAGSSHCNFSNIRIEYGLRGKCGQFMCG